MDTEYQQLHIYPHKMESLAESVEGNHEGEPENHHELSELEETLCSINLTPELQPPDWTKELDLSQCPPSYKENTTQENHLLTISDNFRCQYTHIYPDRKPLLLCPLNECGVMKFVSTTLQSTLLPYSDLYSWEGCASFVADCLSLEPLESSIDLPTYLFSPTWVLRSQRGTCFDFSTLLCSLLLGAGYNAYCVSGYAVKEMCLLNQSMQECPLLVTESTDIILDVKAQKKRYSVKPPREMRSSFERRQEEKKQEEVHAAMLKEQHDAQRLQEERERPPPDNLLGLRVHCWVLVLTGSRDVPDNFFIDPLTGKSYSTADEHFLGMESIWNQHNYWVNMQDCRYGCKNMVYNLGDTVLWESMLYGSATQMLMLNMKREPEVAGIDDDEDETEEPKVFEMPQSWVSKITISEPDMETRYPGGRKVTQYRKAKLERFAPYLLPDGLVTRLTKYKDLECTQTSVVKEWFQHRHDHLEERELRRTDNITLERFRPGNSFCLKSHRYVTMTPETEREMEFYGRVRAGGLVRRVELSGKMTETFEDRDDFLYYRHVVFGRRVTVLEPGETPSPGNRPIQKVIERFHRNRCKPASEDVAERVFLEADERIEVTYHLEDERIIPAWRNFIKLPEAADTKSAHTFTPSMVTSYQVDPFEKPPKNLYLFEMLVALMKENEKVTAGIKESEEEVRAILSSRQQDERGIELHISIYDIARNEKVRLHRENMEPLAAEERERKKEKELDILAPLLAQLGDPETLTRQTAVQLRLDCLANLKQRLIQNANLIQARFEKETQELQLKQQWYQQNQLTMTKEDEDRYLKYCSEAMFRIHVFKLRLSRHKDTAPQKYLSLDEKLRGDPRLAPHLL